MRDLERELRGARVDWPATPDLAAAVLPRLEPREAPRRRWGRYAALLLALLAGGVAAVEPARSAVLEFLGLKSVKIERREPTAPVRPPGTGLRLGVPVTQAEAARRVTFRPRPPAALGTPDGIFYSPGPPSDGAVSYAYRAGDGIAASAQTGVGVLVTEFPASVSPFLEKTIGMGTRVERFSIDGDPAYFISGEAHGVAYQEPGGNAFFEEQRLAGTTLLVERGGLLIRIEGELTRHRAAIIARSIPG